MKRALDYDDTFPGRLFPLCLVSVVAASGCNTGPSLPTPALLGIVESHVQVGAPMTFVGAQLFPTEHSRSDIEFNGIFQPAKGGAPQQVRGVRVMPGREDASTLVLNYLGPYKNPFSADGTEVGQFIGTATAINRDDNDTRYEVRSQPIPVTLTVDPSIIISNFQPLDVTMSCPAPVKRVLGAFDYVISLRAAGFVPINFSVTISGEPDIPVPRTFRVPAQGNNASIGDDKNGAFYFFFEAVPANRTFYDANLDIESLGSDGQVYSSHYVITVHKVIEYITTGKRQLAEYYRPQLVSECYPGSNNGVTYTWTSSSAETAERHADAHWSDGLAQMTGMNGSQSTSNQDRVDVTTGTVDGWQAQWHSDHSSAFENKSTSGWNNAVNGDHDVHTASNTDPNNTTTQTGQEWKGQAGLDIDIYGLTAGGDWTNLWGSSTTTGSSSGRGNTWDVMNGYVNTTYGNNETMHSVTSSNGTNGGTNGETSESTAVGHDYSTEDTEGWLDNRSLTSTYGGDEGWVASSSTSTSQTVQVNVLPLKTAGVFRQKIRWEYPGLIVLYDYCGNHQVLADASFTDFTWQSQVEQGTGCPPTPTILHAAQCYVDCGN
jgi:hypothetical protein